MTLTEEQVDLLEQLSWIQDQIGQSADNLNGLSNSDHLGWNESNELSVEVVAIRDALKTLEKLSGVVGDILYDVKYAK